MAKTIVITSGKGGVGKTTSTANIGTALALQGKKVCLIDMEDDDSKIKKSTLPQIVYLNDLHMLEFDEVERLAQIRPDFAKNLGGFEEWQKQL